MQRLWPCADKCRALGATVVEMLTTRAPFSESEPLVALFRIGQPDTDFSKLIPDGLSLFDLNNNRNKIIIIVIVIMIIAIIMFNAIIIILIIIII